MLLKVKSVLLSLAVVSFIFAGCNSSDEKKSDEELTPSEGLTDVGSADSLGSLTGDSATSGDVVYFGYDEYTLDSAARAAVQAVAEKLKSGEAKAVVVEGHCDERGSIEYNLALGNRRAEAVKAALVSLGVDKASVSTISYGKERPAVDGSNEEAWAKNRRAEFVISN